MKERFLTFPSKIEKLENTISIHFLRFLIIFPQQPLIVSHCSLLESKGQFLDQRNIVSNRGSYIPCQIKLAAWVLDLPILELNEHHG